MLGLFKTADVDVSYVPMLLLAEQRDASHVCTSHWCTNDSEGVVGPLCSVPLTSAHVGRSLIHEFRRAVVDGRGQKFLPALT